MEKISVIVIARNEEQNIKECLDALENLDHEKTAYEVLVIDGGSADKTQSIVRDHGKKNKNIKLLQDPGGSMAHSRNVGIQKAKHPLVAFTDADCIVPKDWLRILEGSFKRERETDSNVAGVGGSNISPEDAGSFVKAIGIAQDSFAGSLGSAQAKAFKTPTAVRSISCTNSIYDKKRLGTVQGFTEELKNRGEDWDLGYKLWKKGYTIKAIPKSFVWHKFRPTPKTFAKNMFFYGETRALLLKKYPDTFASVYALPIIFLIVMASSPVTIIPLAYFPLLLVNSLVVSVRKKTARLFGLVFIVYLVQHFAYSLGMLRGFFKKTWD